MTVSRLAFKFEAHLQKVVRAVVPAYELGEMGDDYDLARFPGIVAARQEYISLLSGRFGFVAVARHSRLVSRAIDREIRKSILAERIVFRARTRRALPGKRILS